MWLWFIVHVRDQCVAGLLYTYVTNVSLAYSTGTWQCVAGLLYTYVTKVELRYISTNYVAV